MTDTAATTQIKSWTFGERALAGLGGFLIVDGVADVLAGIASGGGRDPGLGNFGVTSAFVGVGVVIGVLGGLVSKVAVRRRTARGAIAA